MLFISQCRHELNHNQPSHIHMQITQAGTVRCWRYARDHISLLNEKRSCPHE
uniref:Uncharacterized protein n=1 Tax=Arundo donax TaxID=35708 RepID=A0A0A9TAE8_ARUDO